MTFMDKQDDVCAHSLNGQQARSGVAAPQGRYAGPEASDPGFSPIGWTNMEGKPKRSTH